MNNAFLDKHFLLYSSAAKRLYHDYAKNLPILDYHCHLSPKNISEDKVFKNLTQAWLDGDHYKWRAMRTYGIDEHTITGSASDEEKFTAWATTVPATIGNPLYHWTHLELKRYFSIDQLLNPNSSSKIYQEASNQLNDATLSTQNLLQKMDVELVCTTDDPVDSLEHHQNHTSEHLLLVPGFRPDKAYHFNRPNFSQYLDKLSEASNQPINSFSDYIDALYNRINTFDNHGCRICDHGLNYIPEYKSTVKQSTKELFNKVLAKKVLTQEEHDNLQYEALIHFCKEYHRKGWVQQFHLGALRNTNTRMKKKIGPDTGFDSIGDYPQASSLAQFLDALDQTNQLAKTILYNLNPSDNEVFASMVGNFNDGSVKGKVQFGAAWWFLDQKDGIENHLTTLSNLSLLSCFVGMLTDSRSFLSFPRHEYFRRILCQFLGAQVDRGELPADFDLLGGMIQDVCYQNAKDYFELNWKNSDS